MFTLTHVCTWSINVTHVNLVIRRTGLMCVCVCLFNQSIYLSSLLAILCAPKPNTNRKVSCTTLFADDLIEWHVLYSVQCRGSHQRLAHLAWHHTLVEVTQDVLPTMPKDMEVFFAEEQRWCRWQSPYMWEHQPCIKAERVEEASQMWYMTPAFSCYQ